VTPDRQVGIGVVGAGWMGHAHSRAYLRLPHHYPEIGLRPVLRAIADPVPELRDDAVRRYDFAASYADWTELLDDPAVEVVSVATPPFLHAEIAEAAARAGKHLWLEKPVGHSVEEAERVEAAVTKAGVEARVGFNYRQVPAVATARRMVAEGAIGQVTHASFRMLTDYAAHPLGVLSWRFESERGGDGVIGDLLSHGVDLVRFLLGDLDRVVADTAIFIPDRPLPGGGGSHYRIGAEGPTGPVENVDYAAAMLRTTAGARVFLEGSRVAVGDQNNYGFEIHGTGGRVAWDFRRPGELVVSTGEHYANQPVTTLFVGPGDGDFGRFQPGAGIAMGFDDLKVIECAGLLRAVASASGAAAPDEGAPDEGAPDGGATVQDAIAAARAMAALRGSPPDWRSL
jgi:predicted dehydrogenase